MLITAMNPVLILHFFKGITNAQKQSIIATNQYSEKELKSKVYQTLRGKESFELSWDKASSVASK